MLERLLAVSYTHLDVYKRQVLKEIEENVLLTSFLQSFSFYYQFVNDLQFKSNYGKIVS